LSRGFQTPNSLPLKDMNETGKKLISHGSIYFAGNLMMRGVSFIMLPIYTRYLTPGDFGMIELLVMTIDLVGILLGLRVGQAIFRYYHEYREPRDKHEVVSTSLYLVGILNLVGIALILFFAQPLSILVFGNDGQKFLLMIFSITLFFHAYIEIPMIFIRILERPWLYVCFGTAKLVIQLGLNIYFVVVRQMGIEGIIYSAVISGGIMASVLIGHTLMHTGIGWSLRKAGQLVRFSLPMVATSLISFYITFGDRYFLRAYATMDEVGIYALGYKFGFLMAFIISGPFINIWDSEKYNIYARDDARKLYHSVFLLYSAAILLFLVATSLLVEDVLKIMADPSFWRAHQIVPLILIAYAFNAWYGFTNMGILISKKTVEMTYGTIIAALVATVGYLILIPVWQGTGAAITTILAFGSRCLWTTWRSGRIYDMGLQWGKVGLMGVAAAFFYALSRLSPSDVVLSLTFNLFLVLAFALSLLILPIFPRHWRTEALLAARGKLAVKLRWAKR
jgi:O-antigen/teichoic acid export membrane protein